MVAVPAVGVVRPTIIRMVVDLPAPLGPRKPVTRPVRAVKETSSTTVWPPYVLVSESTVIMGGASFAFVTPVGVGWLRRTRPVR